MARVGRCWAACDCSSTAPPGDEASEADSEEDASSDQSEQQEPENVQDKGKSMSFCHTQSQLGEAPPGCIVLYGQTLHKSTGTECSTKDLIYCRWAW